MAADALSYYADALVTDPVPTKMLTAAFLVTLGDAFSQLTETGREDPRYDFNRGLSFAIFGAVYTGAFQHWWFLFLNDAVPVAPGAGDFQLWLAAAGKTLLCQFGTIPLVYLPLFFILTGLVRGLTVEQTLARARESYLPLFTRNIAYWIPVQMAQFLLVEPEWQVPYVCSAGFIWSIVLSRFAGPIQDVDAKSDPHAKSDGRSGLHLQAGEVHHELVDGHADSKVLLSRLQRRFSLEHRPEDKKAARVLSEISSQTSRRSDLHSEQPAVLEPLASSEGL